MYKTCNGLHHEQSIMYGGLGRRKRGLEEEGGRRTAITGNELGKTRWGSNQIILEWRQRFYDVKG